ncbi:carboxymuconolactone decarboxylase family protein [Nocardia speluncae]|uniref:Carboxymuconolactone decarboxylase family protein n=1 Tax=Nocardia speluncae TaxID=419477 RepID=A0A846XHU9_9NOCA|nr:carboxymuconolactone decarboxylase family protein [Nocardia speluncae]NKY33434.1 carboxymuconolactone decarboxylase family protein [Nocardia speluncae]
MERIAPLKPAQWSAELRAFFADFRTRVHHGGPAPANTRSGTNLLGTLARHPAFTMAFLPFNGHLLYGTALSDRQRELLILRVAHLWNSDYEWAQHAVLGGNAGLTDAEIGRIAEGPGAAGWSPVDAALLRAADDLRESGAVGDSAWQALAAEFDEQQLMDIVFTVGAYAMLAMAMRSFGVRPEPDLEPYLPVRQ